MLKIAVVRWTPSIIGCLLAYSGVYKLIYPGEAIFALRSIGVGRELAKAITLGTDIIELYLATILLLRMNLRFALLMSMALFLLFSCYLSYLSTLANPPACGCLGLTAVFTSNKHNALLGLLRNCVIVWLLKFSYDSYVGQINRVERG